MHIRSAFAPLFERDSAQKEHLEDMRELGRGDLVRHADVVEEFRGDEVGRGDESGSFALGMHAVWVRVDVHVMFGKFWTQNMVVHCVAEGVECLVRVFDGQFDNSRVIEARGVDGRVEVGAVAEALVRREDQELRNSEPRWELGSFHPRHWKRFVLDCWCLRLVPLVEPPAIGSCVSNYGVRRGSRGRRSDFLVAVMRVSLEIFCQEEDSYTK